MKLTLSFDNGPDSEVTPRVLDVLARHAVTAYFFVLGHKIETASGRDLVRRMVAQGHRVGNHSYSHATPLGDDSRSDAAEQEIGATQVLLDPLVPSAPLFRPFGGGGLLGPHLLSAPAVEYLCRHRYTCVLWNSVPRDWEDPQTWQEAALADLAVRPHTLVVLHDIQNACLSRLDEFLNRATSLGHRLVSELPSDCMIIRAGEIVGDLGPLLRGPHGAKA